MIYPSYPNVNLAIGDRTNKSSRNLPLPREHGAWGLLLQPILAAAVLVAGFSWYLLPVLAFALNGFLLREPLTVFVRHRYLWKRNSAESQVAKQWLIATMAGVALSAGILSLVFPPEILLSILLLGAALTGFAVFMTLRNRQRSLALQIFSAVSLTGSGWLVFLMFPETPAHIPWTLWGLMAVHAIAAIPIVHCRLERKAQKPRAASLENGASILVALSPLTCFLLPNLWAPLAFSAAANLWELVRLRDQKQLSQPLNRVGLRLLAASLIHTALTVMALQP
ncbi:YwiC-like family protein [bacterium]|jgi:hypothetical protein|nr:YwiC-like family protein [bacterium]